jgi:type I site-specific restriction-modification system R (restriction) subunit
MQQKTHHLENTMAQSSSYKGNPIQDYVTVAERIEKFYERYPEGRIVTHIIEHDQERGFILMRAEVYRNPDDAQPAATGHAYEYRDAGFVQKTSYIEVGETSAVGRALALCGFEVKRGIASREEMEKQSRMAQSMRQQEREKAPAPKVIEPPAPPAQAERPAIAEIAAAPEKATAAEKSSTEKASTEGLKEEILNLLEALRPGDRRAQRELLVELTGKQTREELTYKEALRLIEKLKAESRKPDVQDDPLM